MTDIDFDELDRAVSSLMGKSSSSASKPRDNVRPLGGTSEPAVSQPAVASPIAVSVTPKPTSAPAARPISQPKGRFMDLVSASQSRAAAPSAPSREGTAVTPRRDAQVGEAKISAPARPLEEPVMQSKDDTNVKVTIGGARSTPSEPARPQEPIVSPFLPDTKVEKRPLGGSSLYASSDEPVSTPDSDTSDIVGAKPELSDELLAVESDNNQDIEPATAPVSKPPVVEKNPDVSSSHQSDAFGASVKSRAASRFSRPSRDDENQAAIYDVSSFSQPLAHPARKKSGWLWVVVIILLLALGSGGAVALYALGLLS